MATPIEGQPNTQKQRPPRYELSKREKEVLNECRKESLLQRSIPAMVVMTLGVRYLAKKGIIRSTRMGLKYFSVGALGYIGGQISYRKKCAQKVLTELPDSKLAKYLQAPPGQRGNFFDTFKQEAEGNDSEMYEQPQGRNYSGNLDFDRTQVPKGLDDRHRPTVDSFQSSSHTDVDQTKKPLSYEELRIQNRQDYDKKANFFNRPDSPTPPPAQQRQPESFVDDQPKTKGKRNKYGDLIEGTET